MYPSRVPTKIAGPNVEKAKLLGNPRYLPILNDIVFDLVLISWTPRIPSAVTKQKH